MLKKLFMIFIIVSSFIMAENIRELTDTNFEKATARNLVVVEFWATWHDSFSDS